MAPLRNNPALPFFILALILLSFGLCFGLIGALQYIIPGFLKDSLSFEKVRPLHVSSVVFWILTAAMGAVLSFIQEHTQKRLRFPLLLKAQFFLFAITTFGILLSYFYGIFGGREYWEFHPYFSIPFLLGWVLFLINVFASINVFRRQPVYIWMWLIGVVFFLFTYIESNLWWMPYFRNQVIKDMTIQWKSYGSMVGAWNMLINGSAIFLMDKIAGNKKYSYSNLGFAIYFLGFFNGLFNWGHHIYTLPTHEYVKFIGYTVSMTELVLLARIIYLWKSSLSTAAKYYHNLSYKFIMAADLWIFLILGLAIAMSVPALNVFMHGTHVVVAHTMGATIGINSMLLFAFIFDINTSRKNIQPYQKIIHLGYSILQISLVIFVGSLITAGFMKAYWQFQETRSAYSSMMASLRPWFILFTAAGVGVMTGFFILIYYALRNIIATMNFNSESIETH